MRLNDKVYDVLKYVVLIVLPACASMWMAVASIWGFGYTEQVVGTITAVDTFLGAVICVSTAEYNKEERDK